MAKIIKKIGSLVGTFFWSYCSSTMAYSFSKYTKEVLSVQGTWHSPNMLLTMAHMQSDFRIITSTSKVHPLSVI